MAKKTKKTPSREQLQKYLIAKEPKAPEKIEKDKIVLEKSDKPPTTQPEAKSQKDRGVFGSPVQSAPEALKTALEGNPQVEQGYKSEKEGFKFVEMPKKPEEDELKKSFESQPSLGAPGQPTIGAVPGLGQGLGDKGLEALDKDYETLGDMIVDIGDVFVLPQKYPAPYDKFSEKENQRIHKYAAQVEKKYPVIHTVTSNFPELGLGLTLIMAGAERRGKEKPKQGKEEESTGVQEQNSTGSVTGAKFG